MCTCILYQCCFVCCKPNSCVFVCVCVYLCYVCLRCCLRCALCVWCLSFILDATTCMYDYYCYLLSFWTLWFRHPRANYAASLLYWQRRRFVTSCSNTDWLIELFACLYYHILCLFVYSKLCFVLSPCRLCMTYMTIYADCYTWLPTADCSWTVENF